MTQRCAVLLLLASLWPELARAAPTAATADSTPIASSAPGAPAATPVSEAPAARVSRTPNDRRPVSPARRTLAVAAALVPGVLVHGSGQFVLGDADTARTLLYLEGIGVGTTVVSGVALAATGASRYTVAPLAIGALGGLGLFGVTLLADLYGALAPEGGTGAPAPLRARLTLWSGLRLVHDPLFSHDYLLSHGFSVDTGPIVVSPSFDWALDTHTQRYELAVSRRLHGRTSTRAAATGTGLDARAAVSDHAYSDDGFGFTTLELGLEGRLDLQALGPRLEGSFAEAALGYARQWLRYDLLPGDATDELLARVGFGIYLGRPGGVHGESWIAYDHRRDTFAGGLKMPGVPAGYAGHVAQRTELFFDPRVGAAFDVQYGSALIAGLYLLLRPGEHR